MKKEIKEVNRYYTARGYVLGNMWGGGLGWYEAKPSDIYEDLQALKKDLQTALEDGTLDAGWGFEKLIGAALTITTTEVIEIQEKKLTHEERTPFILFVKPYSEDVIIKAYEHTFGGEI